MVTVQWDAAIQAIADRYPSTTDYLFPIIKSDDKLMEVEKSEGFVRMLMYMKILSR